MKLKKLESGLWVVVKNEQNLFIGSWEQVSEWVKGQC